MDGSIIAIILFIVITIIYYAGIKPKLTTAILEDPKLYSTYAMSLYGTLFVYFLAAVLSQFGLNISVLIATCGGSVLHNINSAAYITLVPWVFIFGALIGVIVTFPGFKSAFSNVIGYFVVSNTANKLLTELLKNQEVESAIDGDVNAAKNREAYQSAADAIIKLFGNTSILINQIVPENFEEYWNMLTPLMKEGAGTPEMKQKLLDTVALRDNIGEAMWYVYASILIISITQFQMAANGCQQDIAMMQAKHDDFVKNEDARIAQDNKIKSQTYTIT